MESSETPRATMNELMASGGYLLLQWGFLESELDESVTCLREHVAETSGRPISKLHASEKLAEWKRLQLRIREGRLNHRSAVTELYEAIAASLATRNAICHGLAGASAPPLEGEAHVLTKTRGTRVKRSLTELNRTIRLIEAHRHALQRLTRTAIAKTA